MLVSSTMGVIAAPIRYCHQHYDRTIVRAWLHVRQVWLGKRRARRQR
jgi:hypothetical protein